MFYNDMDGSNNHVTAFSSITNRLGELLSSCYMGLVFSFYSMR